MVNKQIKKILSLIIFSSVFIFLYFMFIYYFYISPNEYNISILLLLGFATVITGIFIFFSLNHEIENKNLFRVKTLSENSIKLILIVAMSIAIFISPISSPKTIIVWDKVSIFHFIRAFVFLIGCAFLPGANLYNLIFSKNNLHQRFKVDHFILKITLYPLFSFSFVGLSVLVLDQLGLVRNIFELVLFSLILGLYLLDLIIQQFRERSIKINLDYINFSKYNIIILILSTGIILISLGIHFGKLYLIPGDSWIGLAPNNYIGISNTSPIEWGKKNHYYPIFWSYISFGISILCGLPYFNTNALLAIFCYLYITSTYLLMKAILFNYKEKYVIFSTILVSITSDLFYFKYDYGHGGLPGITFLGEFYFIYKSYAYILFIVAIAFFIFITKTSNNSDIDDNESKRLIDFKFLILISFFLIISFMLYMLPLLMGITFLFLYCLLSAEYKKNTKLLSHFLLCLLIIFILLDILMEFYLSTSIYIMSGGFFGEGLITFILNFIPSYFLIYSIFCGLFIITVLMNLIHINIFNAKKKISERFTFNSTKIFRYFLGIFTILLIIETIVIISSTLFSDLELTNKITFFYYIDMLFINFGFIGIIGVYLSFISFQKDRNLFYVLITWIILSILIASILIFINWFNSYSIFFKAINKQERFMMEFWFKRIWHQSIFPLSILASIGLIKVAKKVEHHQIYIKFFKTNTRKKILKFISISLLIFLSYTNLIFAGIWYGTTNNKPNTEEVKLLGWMSENIDPESNILIEEDYFIRVGIFSMVNGRYYFIDDVFDSDDTVIENMEEIDYLRDNDIEYLLIHEDLLYGSSNMSKFIRYYLRPYFYNESEHETDNYRLYYAPYFD